MECLAERPSLSRRHHVLNGQGYELLALGLQGYSNVSDLSGSRLEQKFLDYTGIRKLNKQEVWPLNAVFVKCDKYGKKSLFSWIKAI